MGWNTITEGDAAAFARDGYAVVRRLLKFAAGGTPVHYLPGNHDGALRRYLPLGLGELHLDDRLELDLDGVRTLFLHGDAADLLLGTPRWVARLGALSYDALEWTSNRLNAVRRWCGRPPRSLAATVKANLAAAQRHVARFEEVCARLAAERGCGAVVCGHIHVAADRRLRIGERSVRYLNSGDWVDSLTALEYDAGSWRVARWHELAAAGAVRAPELDETAAVGAA